MYNSISINPEVSSIYEFYMNFTEHITVYHLLSFIDCLYTEFYKLSFRL